MLPLLLLGKAVNIRAFKKEKSLPVVYKASTKGLMTRSLFTEWFKTCFKTEVKKKALLLEVCVSLLKLRDYVLATELYCCLTVNRSEVYSEYKGVV